MGENLLDNLWGSQFRGCPMDKEKILVSRLLMKQLPVYPFDISMNVTKICINNKIFLTVT